MVISQIVTVERLITADEPDFLAGTQLDQPGVPGVYTVWAASDAADSTITITLGGRTITNAALIVQRTGPEIRENEDLFFQMQSIGVGRPVININEIAAANIRIRVKFLPALPT